MESESLEAENKYNSKFAVAVALITHKNEILLIRRSSKVSVEPNGLAFPGGYMEGDESWKQSLSRELVEETGIETEPDRFVLAGVKDSSNFKNLLVFGAYELNDEEYEFAKLLLEEFKENDEISEVFFTDSYRELCFESHDKLLAYIYKNG